MICLLMPVLGVRSSSASGVHFEEKVARTLASTFLSRKGYLSTFNNTIAVGRARRNIVCFSVHVCLLAQREQMTVITVAAIGFPSELDES